MEKCQNDRPVIFDTYPQIRELKLTGNIIFAGFLGLVNIFRKKGCANFVPVEATGARRSGYFGVSVLTRSRFGAPDQPRGLKLGAPIDRSTPRAPVATPEVGKNDKVRSALTHGFVGKCQI